MGVAEAPRTWWTRTARIREKFPNPRTGPDENGHYCVGGAFLRYYSMNGGFPSTETLANGLVKINPNLPWVTAIEYASTIIYRNDSGDVCGAWETLERALTY